MTSKAMDPRKISVSDESLKKGRMKLSDIHSKKKSATNILHNSAPKEFAQMSASSASLSSSSSSSSSVNDENIEELSKQENIQANTDRCSYLQFELGQMKKKFRPLMRQEMKQTMKSNNICIKIIFFLLISIIAVIIGSLLNEFDDNSFDFINASVELKEKIYGQDKAINELINYYHKNTEAFNVIVLIGGSGVGKSYTGKIIRKYFVHSHNIFEYNPPFDNIRESSSDTMSLLHCNLLILEHLKLNHLADLVDFIKYLDNKDERHCATILAIINPEEINDNLIKTINLEASDKLINQTLSSINIPFKTIIYVPLTSDIIDMCIKDEAKNSGIILTKEEFLEVKKHLLLINSGCKGAYAKVQLYAQQHSIRETK